MFCILLAKVTCSDSLVYQDNTNQTLIGCSSECNDEIIIPQAVIEIFSYDQDNYAFKNCKTQITSLRFELGCQVINISSYGYYPTNLVTVNLNECTKLTLLDSYVFNECTNLQSVILPLNIIRNKN